jgi:hypothetical protein
MATVEGLDPAGEAFADQVIEAAKAWADGNPKFKAAKPPSDGQRKPPVTRPSADFGAAPASRQWTQADVNRASPQELEKAMAEGLLKDLGIGKTKPSRYARRSA